MIDALLFGTLAGAVRSLSGYLKDSNAETFEWKKFAFALVRGMLIGLMVDGLGMDYDLAVQILTVIGIDSLIYSAAKYLVNLFL